MEDKYNKIYSVIQVILYLYLMVWTDVWSEREALRTVPYKDICLE
jgi:hypothetical protein